MLFCRHLVHNGSAADLRELVNFYNQRFAMSFSDQQKGQLVAFLNSLEHSDAPQP
jgi:cytochrome c peroxidase